MLTSKREPLLQLVHYTDKSGPTLQLLQFLGHARQVLLVTLPYVDMLQFRQDIDFQSKYWVELQGARQLFILVSRMLSYKHSVHCSIMTVAADAVVKLHEEQRVEQILQFWLVLLYQEFEGHGLHIWVGRSNVSFTGQEGLH
jgi:hypothetical protein